MNTKPKNLSIKDYINKVSNFIKTNDSQKEELLSDISLCVDNKRIAQLKETLEGFLIDTEAGYVGLVEIYHLSDVNQLFLYSKFKIYNWHYDRTTQCLLVNLARGVHEHLSASLFKAYRSDKYQNKDNEFYAEQFLEEGLGWFKSSSSYGRALKGVNVKLDSQEKLAFKEIEFFDK